MDYKKILSEVRDSINSSIDPYEGGDVAQFLEGGSQRWPDEDLIRTGSLPLDMAIGIGGIPRGRVIEIHGEFSSGKTTTALHIVANAQKAGIPCVFIDAENALDKVYMEKLGVDLDFVLIAQTSITEEAIEVIIKSMESVYEKFKIPPLIILDSIPALAPMESKEGKESIAAGARVWSRRMPGVLEAMRKTGGTLLTINQLRDGIGPYAGQTTPGGRALKFANSVQIAISRDVEGDWWKDSSGGRGIDGQAMKFTVKKNKVASPFKIGTSFLPAGQPIDWVSDVIEEASKHGVILKNYKATPMEDGRLNLEEKQRWSTYIFTDEEVDLLNKKAREEAEKEGLEDIDDPYTYGHYICVYNWNPFVKELEVLAVPDLLPLMEERVLNTLNYGGTDPSVDKYIWDPNRPAPVVEEPEEVEETVEEEPVKAPRTKTKRTTKKKTEPKEEPAPKPEEEPVIEAKEESVEEEDEDVIYDGTLEERAVKTGAFLKDIKGGITIDKKGEPKLVLEDKDGWYTYLFSPEDVEALNKQNPGENFGIGSFVSEQSTADLLTKLIEGGITEENIEEHMVAYTDESLREELKSVLAS